MKYVSLTFDDGRDDNYSIAYPILKNLGLSATLFCTTGFIDGTWEKKEDWYSAERALDISQLKELQQNGWEIALHGDKHITEYMDTQVAINKLTEWNLFNRPTGMSLPNSFNTSKIKEIIARFYPETIAYVRGGRARNTRDFSSRLLFAFYTFLKLQWAYNIFNKPNFVRLQNKNRTFIPSVVIRQKDDPKMVLKFINQLPSGAWVSLMLHSIHRDENVYKNDPWNWSESKFKELCEGLLKQKECGLIDVLPMIDVVQKY